ncbi:MAG: septation protein A [Methylophilaceae bacterium]|nr:septation protein A [Methylophilaceae bacterium]
MKFLFDLFPVILFFITFKLAGIFAATAAAIIATLIQIGWVKWHHGKVDGMLWASGLIVVVFGGSTLFLHDETYIKWKPTVLYWLFALVLFTAQLIWKKNLIRNVLEQHVHLPEPVWPILNHAWVAFFALLGVANLYVAFHYPTDTWVDFKMFGATGLMLVFVVLQSLFISKYVEEKEAE